MSDHVSPSILEQQNKQDCGRVPKDCKPQVLISLLYGSRKYPSSPTEGHWKFLEVGGGGGSSTPNFKKKSMKLNWNFQGGVGVQNKLPSMRGV